MAAEISTGRTKEEILAFASALDTDSEAIAGYISGMKEMKARGSMEIDLDKLKTVLTSGKTVLEDVESHKGKMFRQMIQDLFASNDVEKLHCLPEVQEKLEMIKTQLSETAKRASTVRQSIDEFHHYFIKYNIRKYDDFDEYEDFLDETKNFIKLEWRKVAKKLRKQGEKSLIERVKELDAWDEVISRKRKITALDLMKTLAIDLGCKISEHVAQLYLLMTVSTEKSEERIRNFEQLAKVLQELGVIKRENSIIIERFVNVAQYLDRTFRVFAPFPEDLKVKKLDATFKHNVIRLMLREVLRLEAAFRYPDSPDLHGRDELLRVRSRLRKVFSKQLERISTKIEELRIKSLPKGEEDQRIIAMKKQLDAGIKDIWMELDPNQ
ncbi:hypothetical protein TorRG33x02_192110 [Trema orientale]|uniref:Uncharacterized protein n=1 Tax=Trema orientale TaxID=63057 RepID=A0A2P5EHF6_TREOI|nr:hypothetical protein TorRG33x02_192110 [Trema orientale]